MRARKVKIKQGEITAFLSLVMVLMVSFITAMLESAVAQTAKNEQRLAVDMAVYSMFGEYQKDLLDNFHVFALDGSYETGSFAEETLIDRIRYYGAVGMEHELTAIQLLTDDSGQAFREQVLYYMEEMFGIEFIRKYTGMTSGWTEQTVAGNRTETDEQKTLQELSDTLTENETELPAEDNPLANMEQVKKTGILSMVLPKGFALSSKKIFRDNQVSGRNLRHGKGNLPMRNNIDGAEANLLFQEYLLMNFFNAVETEPEMKESAQKRSLAYEVEYILEGEDSDAQNLEAVVKKLLTMRIGINYVYLLSDSVKRAEVQSMALSIATVAALPAISTLIEQALLAAWAFGESIMDLRALLAGKRTALFKSAETWQLSLSSLITLGTGEDALEGQDVEGGISYREYLRALLFVRDSKTLTMRVLDRVEQNIIYEQGKKFFRADQCVTKIRIQNKAIIHREVTYEFPVYFGYI